MNLTTLHQLLIDHFSEEELKTFCFQLGVNYEDLPGEGRSAKARELVTYMQRRIRLPELEAAIHAHRPPPDPPSLQKWRLSRDDFSRLVAILQTHPDFRTENRRVDFLDDVFAGSPRKDALVGLIDLSGAPRAAAVRLVERLVNFGQHEPGQETLGLLVNRLREYLGGGSDAEFLGDLFHRYPLTGQPVAARGLDDAWRGHESPQDVQEKIIGENTLRHVRLLELALQASRAVVRIRNDAGLGSGFLAAPGLIMTNHHVIAAPSIAHQSAFTFNYQLDVAGNPASSHTSRALPDGLFYTNPNLDVTVVEIEETPSGVAPLRLARLRVQRDQRVSIIQHPGGHYKKISMQNNFIAYADTRHIQYLTSTEPGSSGSPVFNDDFVVVGIHHSGGNLPEPGTNRRYLRNAGSSMIAVLADLQQNAPQIYARLNQP